MKHGTLTTARLHLKIRKATKMQEIITEILEIHGFPTKNVEKLTTLLENWKLKDLTALTVITSDKQIMGFSMGNRIIALGGIVPTFSQEWRYCSLGSELVVRLKGGE
ncbi:MAG: hypothetical protein ACK5U7_08160 [Bacteroidota bacterium]